jgi:hypothetical protein
VRCFQDFGRLCRNAHAFFKNALLRCSAAQASQALLGRKAARPAARTICRAEPEKSLAKVTGIGQWSCVGLDGDLESKR